MRQDSELRWAARLGGTVLVASVTVSGLLYLAAIIVSWKP